MKSALIAFALLMTIPALSQNAPVEFKTKLYSFGKIPQNKPVTTEFTFTNTSAKPVVIENATAGCGCTTPVYPETPIMKGKTGTIKVTYNAAQLGSFSKNVMVKFANVDQPVELKIEGEVVK